jgi:hypothetical protein
MGDDAVYVSKVRIERVKGPYWGAYLPVESEPAAFGVHSAIAQHHGTDMKVHEPH